MSIRWFAVASAIVIFATPLRGQIVAPVAVVNHSSSSRSITLNIEADSSHVRTTPFVVIGGLVGAAAGGAYFVHVQKAGVRNEDMFTPGTAGGVFLVGLGALIGGGIGYLIHDWVAHPADYQ